MLTPSFAPFAGYRFLIIENEVLQAYHLRDMVFEMGGSVTDIAYSYEQARGLVDSATFDCALLDINLSGTLSFRIAEILQERGIPFIVCTAYADAAVDVHRSVHGAPRLAKPVESADLRDAVLGLRMPLERR